MSFGAIAGATIGAVGAMSAAKKSAGASRDASAQAAALGREYAPPVYFKPYGLTTTAGQTGYNPSTGFNVGLSPQYAGIQQQALGGLGGALPMLTQQAMQAPNQFGFQYAPEQIGFDYSTQAPQFGYDYDPSRTAQDIFSREAALLQPQFQQQTEALRSGLFGSGRMGLQLAGESVGAGAGGMVQPDAFGLGRAQSQTLANLAASASERAQAAEMQRYGVESGMFGTNLAAQQAMQSADLARFGAGLQGMSAAQQAELAKYGVQSGVYGLNQAAQQQYLGNLSGLTQGLFGMGTQVTGLESQLMQLGLSAEQARSAAAANAGTIGAGLGSAAINAQLQGAQQQAQTMGGLFGGLGQAVGQWSPFSGAGNIGTAAGTLGTATSSASAGLSSFLRQ